MTAHAHEQRRETLPVSETESASRNAHTDYTGGNKRASDDVRAAATAKHSILNHFCDSDRLPAKGREILHGCIEIAVFQPTCHAWGS